MAEGSKPPDNPMDREAKENIDAVKDIVGAKDELTQLQSDLARQRMRLDETRKQRYSPDTADDIRDYEHSIRELEHKINTFESTTASLDLFADSAVTAESEARQAAFAESQRKAAEARQRQAEAAAKAKSAADAQIGPTERAVIDEQSTILAGLDNPHLETQLTDARHKDDAMRKGIEEGRKAGCVTTPAVLAGIGIGAAVVIAVIVVLLNGGNDDKKAPVSAGANPPAAGAAGAGGDAPGGELANFAGHYVLTQGLDDPSGLDLHNYGGRSADSLGASDATIDIGTDGTITGGSYHVSGDSQGCHYTMNGDTATGNVTQSATGAIIFNGTQTEAGDKCQTTTFATGRPFQFGIVGDELFMCRSNMATVSTCEAVYPRLVAKFVKQS